jgi:methionyl-tRNA formyltransferase
MNKVLIFGPIWRNQNTINFIEKRGFDVHFTNSKLTKNFVVINKIDMIVTSGYPYRVKKDVIETVKIAVNLHISFLPFGRGIVPNLWSFVEGYPSDITIHFLDENFDTGKIIVQKKINFKFSKNQTLKTTHDILLKKLEKFYFIHFKNIINGKFKGFDQDKFYKINRYHSREESENLMRNFKRKWNTKIETIRKYAKKNKFIS